MWWYFLIEGLIFIILLVFDLTSKAATFAMFEANGDYRPVIEDFIGLRKAMNTGGGWSILNEHTIVLTVITAIFLGIILSYLLAKPKASWLLRIPLVLIFTGGIGNLVDRITLGYVRDFIFFEFWYSFPTFNLADNFLTIGTFWLVIYLIVMIIVETKKERDAKSLPLTMPATESSNMVCDEIGKVVEPKMEFKDTLKLMLNELKWNVRHGDDENV